jgi:hypothetical protein
MRLAKVVFIGAGIWGITVLTPLYWLVDITGRRYEAPANHPHFFFGFLSVAMAWQVAFLVIGVNPIRLRPLMVPAMLEKFGHVATVVALYAQGRIGTLDAQAAVPDFVLGVLFVAAFAMTTSSRTPQSDGRSVR